MPIPEPGSPPPRGRRDPALARELAAAREQPVVRRDDEPYDDDDYPDGVVHTVDDGTELTRDQGEPDPDVYAVMDDLVVVKVTHELPQMNGGSSWYTAGMTTRLDPGETPAEGLQRAQRAVNDHLVQTFNDDFAVVADMHDAATNEIKRRERNKRIGD